MADQKVPKINFDLFEENKTSKRLYTIMLKWAGFANRHYTKWDVRENCGYYFGGAYVYEIESVFTSLTMSILSVLGDYDETLTGIPRREMEKRAISAIRYLCFTHTSGPKDCVRVRGRYEAFSNKKWGFIYDNFFRDSQTGVGTSAIGIAAWLLWDKLDVETKTLVKNLLISYADKFSDMRPGTGVYNDTQCEENAWTALGISTALYMFPEHPNNKKWLAGYINWSLNSTVTYKDKLENEWDKVSYESRGGVEKDGKLYGVSAVTFHPDFTTENHGYVHPDYMAAGIVLRATSAIMPILLGKEPNESCTYNFKNLYEITIKPITSMDGNNIPIQGQDWFYHKHHNKLFIHTAMNLLFNDLDAAFFEEQSIDIVEKRQASIGSGGLMENNGEKLQIAPGKKTAFDMEGPSVRTIAYAYLMHIAKKSENKPSSKEKVGEKLCGNYFYPYGGVYIHRTPNTFTSFSTRCSVMGLSMPLNGLWDITSDFMGFTGRIKALNDNDGYFKTKMVNWKDIGIETKNLKIDEHKSGFSIYAEVPRAEEKIMQAVSFTALPDGNSVYMERVLAVSNVNIALMETGRISIGNEDFNKLGDLAKGYRDVWFNEHKETFRGSYGKKDEIKEYSNIKYINVDGKIGYLIFGDGNVKYNNMHNFPKWKGLENILVCNNGRTGVMSTGDRLPVFIMASIPNADFKKTKDSYENTKVTYKLEDTAVLRFDKFRISANFSKEEKTVTEKLSCENNSIYIFPGTTVISKDNLKCTYKIRELTSAFYESRIIIQLKAAQISGQLDVLCSDNNDIWIHNSSDVSIEYSKAMNGETVDIVHEAGKILKI